MIAAFAGVACCMLFAVLAAVWCARVDGAGKGMVWFAMAAAMPAAQLVLAVVVLALIWTHGMAAVYVLAVVAAMAFCCVGDCALAKGSAQVRGRAANVERLKSACERERAVREYEELLEKNASQMQRLCGEFSAELRGLKAQMASGECDFSEVEAALESLEKGMRTRFCANKTANAILLLKARACADNGVSFGFEGAVPEALDIDDLQLCSVFSNLLDNAINAAREANSEHDVGAGDNIDASGGERVDVGALGPFVRVRCSTQGAYLTVAIENSCKEDVPSRLRFRHGKSSVREHGWGLEIVEQIAKEHDGSFSLKRLTPNQATAIAVLKCVKRDVS